MSTPKGSVRRCEGGRTGAAGHRAGTPVARRAAVLGQGQEGLAEALGQLPKPVQHVAAEVWPFAVELFLEDAFAVLKVLKLYRVDRICVAQGGEGEQLLGDPARLRGAGQEHDDHGFDCPQAFAQCVRDVACGSDLVAVVPGPDAARPTAWRLGASAVARVSTVPVVVGVQ